MLEFVQEIFKRPKFPREDEFRNSDEKNGEKVFFEAEIKPLKEEFKKKKIDCYYQFQKGTLEEKLDFVFLNKKAKKMLHLELKKWAGYIMLNKPRTYFFNEQGNRLSEEFCEWLKSKVGTTNVSNYKEFWRGVNKQGATTEIISIAVSLDLNRDVKLEVRDLGVAKFNKSRKDCKHIFSDYTEQVHKILFLNCKTDQDKGIERKQKFSWEIEDAFMREYCLLNEAENYNLLNELLERYVY